MLHRLFQNDFFDATRRKIAMICFALSFVAMPAAQLVRDMNVGKDVHTMSRELRKLLDMRARAASSQNWRESLCLSYHLNLKYYGIPRPGITERDLQSELRRNSIDYFFVWDEGRNYSRYLSDYEEVTRGKVPGLHLYYLGYD